MRFSAHVGLGVLSLALAGCRAPQTAYQPTASPKVAEVAAREGLDQDLFPLTEGNEWKFTLEASRMTNGRVGRSASGIVAYRVTQVEKTPEEVRATVEISLNDLLTDRQVWLVNSKGLWQVSSGLKPNEFDPPQPIIPFPVREGAKFWWKGLAPFPNGKEGEVKLHGWILGRQEVDSAAGRYSAYAVQIDTSYDQGTDPVKTSATFWFAPGVGMVRLQERFASKTVLALQLLKLKSRSLKHP
ncbi:MAG: hypothetical protein HYR64_04070 [Fimbriimonas ginsengisoli]|uniref:Lipoprotein n=1 Tax=Fimbriimonas ginsengisoli TaxID=1005039 RepID=A0A931PU80_FIMGI|nr:hypothetical protein [Fimbriimonas ginsengisoli]